MVNLNILGEDRSTLVEMIKKKKGNPELGCQLGCCKYLEVMR